MRWLHDELYASQERLTASRSDHGIALQELRAANEELQSINEEYRSASEQLETSKEELQSTNEELRTVNTELKKKLESVSSAHSDLRNLVDSLEIGTLFLDYDLRIRMFTPRVADLFNITDADAGRSITDFTSQLVQNGIAKEARAVLVDLKPSEREVATTGGRWLILRFRPYRTLDEKIDGVVVTFIDATELKQATEKLRHSEEKYRTLFETMVEGFVFAEPIFDADGAPVDIVFHEANPAALTLIGTDLPRLRGATAFGFDPSWLQMPSRVVRSGVPELNVVEAGATGRAFELSVWKSVRDARWVEISVRDVTERVQTEHALREAEARQRALIEGLPQLIWRADRLGQWRWVSPQWCAYTGLSAEDSINSGWLAAVHPDDRAQVSEATSTATATRSLSVDARIYYAAERRYRWFQSRAAAVVDETGDTFEWFGTCTDIDDLRGLQEQQLVMVAELQHRTRNLLGVVRSIGQQTLASAGSLDDFGGRFADRLDALSRVQGLLSRSGTGPIALGDLVRMELDALSDRDAASRIVVEGPRVLLRPSSVQTLALALHELATNALKYGALSSADGRLSITWQTTGLQPTDRLVLTWQETNVPVQAEPRRAGGGYGRTLIERALPYALGAVTSLELKVGTVRCIIDLPLGKVDKVESD